MESRLSGSAQGLTNNSEEGYSTCQQGWKLAVDHLPMQVKIISGKYKSYITPTVWRVGYSL